MLRELQIRNVALIDYVSIVFEQGFCVLTGETGAGKSIIIDSINAVLGGRVSREIIKTGADRAVVEANFDVSPAVCLQLEAYGIEPDDCVVIYREIQANGKSICRINGRMVSVSILHDIASGLVDIHGQHDNQSLLNKERHIDLLDQYAGDNLTQLGERYSKTWERHTEVRNQLRSLIKAEGEREREIDILEYQINEINESGLHIDEDVELEKKRAYLRNATKIQDNLASAYVLLNGNENDVDTTVEKVSVAAEDIDAISEYSQRYKEIAGRLAEISYSLEDIALELRREADQTDISPKELEETEERLDAIRTLKKKYGPEIKDVLDFLVGAEKKKDILIKSEVLGEELRAEEERLRAELIGLAKEMTIIRKEASLRLEKEITDSLNDLEMKNVEFKASFDESNKVLNEKGADLVEFLISPNKGEVLKPLNRIASGGELSRIMLAIKGILADIDEVATLIFDEIDAGLGGVAAQKTGEKLSRLAGKHQVICVTHQAQIASFARTHFLISKAFKEERMVTSVEKIDNDERIEEIARLLSGTEAREISRAHAAQLLESAN